MPFPDAQSFQLLLVIAVLFPATGRPVHFLRPGQRVTVVVSSPGAGPALLDSFRKSGMAMAANTLKEVMATATVNFAT